MDFLLLQNLHLHHKNCGDIIVNDSCTNILPSYKNPAFHLMIVKLYIFVLKLSISSVI